MTEVGERAKRRPGASFNLKLKEALFGEDGLDAEWFVEPGDWKSAAVEGVNASNYRSFLSGGIQTDFSEAYGCEIDYMSLQQRFALLCEVSAYLGQPFDLCYAVVAYFGAVRHEMDAVFLPVPSTEFLSPYIGSTFCDARALMKARTLRVLYSPITGSGFERVNASTEEETLPRLFCGQQQCPTGAWLTVARGHRGFRHHVADDGFCFDCRRVREVASTPVEGEKKLTVSINSGLEGIHSVRFEGDAIACTCDVYKDGDILSCPTAMDVFYSISRPKARVGECTRFLEQCKLHEAEVQGITDLMHKRFRDRLIYASSQKSMLWNVMMGLVYTPSAEFKSRITNLANKVVLPLQELAELERKGRAATGEAPAKKRKTEDASDV